MHGLVAQSPGPSPKREPHCAAASAWRPAQGLGVQAKVLGVPPEHVQLTVVLDGSQGGRPVVVVVELVVVDVVVAVSQTWAALQVSPAGQSPQFSVSGQLPSLMRPHSAPAAVQLVGVQHCPLGRFPGG